MKFDIKKFPTLAKIVTGDKVETHCYTTWHEGLRKIGEAQEIFNKAMNMAASEGLPMEMKAQLSQFVSDIYSLQANAEELFEDLRDVDPGAPPKPKEPKPQEEKTESSTSKEYTKVSEYGNPSLT